MLGRAGEGDAEWEWGGSARKMHTPDQEWLWMSRAWGQEEGYSPQPHLAISLLFCNPDCILWYLEIPVSQTKTFAWVTILSPKT